MGYDVTPRMKQIILALLAQPGAVSIKRLSEQVRISKRTVQRELGYLPRVLKRYGMVFCSKTGTGIWIEGNDENRKFLKRELEEEDTLDISDKTERQKRLILEILKDKSLKKLYYYSNLFRVSEATIRSDLEAVMGWFLKYHLEIRRKPGVGVLIEGSERDFRSALRMFIDENIDSDIIWEMYEDQQQSVMDVIGRRNERNIYRILDRGIVKRVTGCILGIRDKRILNLTQDSYLGLVIHIAIAVNRIMKEEIIEENPAMAEQDQGDMDYRLAERIAYSLEQEFCINIPKVERTYICLHIKGSKIQQPEPGNQSGMEIEESRELWEVVDEMIDCYDSEMACLLKQDEKFVIQGLIAHLKPTLVRLANGMKIQNPLLEQIKRDYSAIYKRCENVAAVIERRYGYKVPEPEIGFLAIHFGAAEVLLQNQKDCTRKVNVGIVCASGIGISRLMCSQISRFFADRVELTTYGGGDLTPYIIKKNDFLISTLQLKVAGDILYVSPLLPSEDMERIAGKVRHYEHTPKKTEDVEFISRLDQVNRTAVQMMEIIQNMGYHQVDNNISFDEILMTISQMLALRGDCQALIRKDLKKREGQGSQIVPDLGIALFHARTDGVEKPVFSVCHTKNGGPFSDAYFKGVCSALVMLIPNDDQVKENSGILGFLSQRLVEEEEFLETVKYGGKEEIRRLVSKQLNQYFNQFWH